MEQIEILEKNVLGDADDLRKDLLKLSEADQRHVIAIVDLQLKLDEQNEVNSKQDVSITTLTLIIETQTEQILQQSEQILEQSREINELRTFNDGYENRLVELEMQMREVWSSPCSPCSSA
jgi:hypothetical protein